MKAKLCFAAAGFLLLGAGKTYPQCESNCVITNPKGNQTIQQPGETQLSINHLLGDSTAAASFTFGVDPNLDLSSWNPAMLRVGRTVNLRGGSEIGSANQFGAVIHMVSNRSESLASYEKDGLFVRVSQADPSSGTSITRDGVGIHGAGEIASTNLDGRTWGADFTATINAGGDGLATATELDIINNSTAQPLIDTTNSKYALTIVPMGTKASTAGIWYATTGPGFFRGIIVRNIVPGGDALNIPNNIPITARDASDTADLNMLYLNPANALTIGSPKNSTMTLAAPGIWNDSPAMKHINFGPTCEVAGGVGNTCASEFSWPTPFHDANYTVSCSGVNGTGVPIVQRVSKAPGGISVHIANLGESEGSFAELDCIAVHN
jgi:hypothetical protein